MNHLQQTRPKPLSPAYIHENILLLRRRMKLSQKEFMETFLKELDGTIMLSAGSYSAFENGGGKSAKRIASVIAGALHVDPELFELPPDGFALNVDTLLERVRGNKGVMQNVTLRRNESYTDALVRVITDYLTDGIMNGEIRPGDKIPSDRELAERFSVGRSTIREALRVISLIGLIEIRPGQGTFVAADSSDFFVTPLSWTFLLGQRSVENILDIRNILEVGSVQMATKLASEENLRDFSRLISRMTEAYHGYDFKAFLDLDLDFHLLIAECSQNPIIFELLRTSRKLVTLVSRSGMETVEQLQEIYNEHLAIYEAIRNHDEQKAMDLMKHHLDCSAQRYTYQKKGN